MIAFLNWNISFSLVKFNDKLDTPNVSDYFSAELLLGLSSSSQQGEEVRVC